MAVLRRSYLLIARRGKRLCLALWCDQYLLALSHRSVDYRGDEGGSSWGCVFRFALLLDGHSLGMESLSGWVLVLGMEGLVVVVWCTSWGVHMSSAEEFAGARGTR